MDIRYSTGKEPFSRMNTEEIRKEFLIQNIFEADDVSAVYSHVDRIVTLGCMPVSGKVSLTKNIDPMKDFGVNSFLERRELGMINIGGPGKVVVDGKEYGLAQYDGMYIGQGAKEVAFFSENGKTPAKFYMNSCPAHCHYPTKLIPYKDAVHKKLGSL
ncbi:MAG: 5-dehydro-4-deoxy-D-glucuronate isomerase, partial [Sphaerochaetaceae bacterium]